MRRAGVFLLLILLSRSAAVRRLTVWLAVWREGQAGFNVHDRGAVGGGRRGAQEHSRLHRLPLASLATF